jgi:hypothetical protein
LKIRFREVRAPNYLNGVAKKKDSYKTDFAESIAPSLVSGTVSPTLKNIDLSTA